MTSDRHVRLTVVLTHPIQYFAPWFRYIEAHEPAVALTVLYEKQPTAEEQGAGFGTPFEWDTSPLEGYRSVVLHRAGMPAGGRSDVASSIAETTPDAVLIPGWHSPFYRRALTACRRRHIPVLYRGDSTLQIRHRGLAEVAWTLRTQMRLAQFDGFLSVGTRSRQFLEELGAPSDRIFNSPHAVDNAFFSAAAAPYKTTDGRRAARERFGIGAGELVVLFAGKLDAIKRPLDAIRAAAAANATLLVAGDGALRDDMLQEAARTGARMHLAGFLNQSQMPHAYAAADCLVLPSERETWGLVVNEAMATGLPCIVSDTCGCAPDLINAETGAVFSAGDTLALQRAIESVVERRRLGHAFDDACRHRVASFGYAQASAGLVEACAAVATTSRPEPSPRVLLWAGHFVSLGGMERTALDVARVAIERGGSVHCLVNRWDSTRIRTAVESFGATWSTVFHRQALSRRLWQPATTARILLDVAVSSLELRHAVARCRATHVIVPEFAALIRCAPAIAWMRLRRQPTVISLVQNAPITTSPFYRALWRYLIGPLTTRFVCNSQYTRSELAKNGVPGAKIETIHNMAPTRTAPAVPEPTPPADVVYIGQLIPEKGVGVLLEAIALLNRRGRAATLNIVGDLSGWVHPLFHGYRESLIARADAADLAGRVRFLGWREDIPTVMKAASMHCCPSLIELREAFGNVVAEAKLCGRPSVVTRSGALPEIVEHRVNGWVCDEVTAEAIAEGIEYFLSQPETLRSAARAARESYIRSFSRERFEERWAQVLGLRAADRAPIGMAAPLAMKRRAANGHHDETI